MDKIRVDYLHHHEDYKVVQHEQMYHFNTDTCLLGEFIQIHPGEKVLDVGTNNGALLVYIYHKGGEGYGLEINQEALKIAQMTLNENHFQATLIHADFKTYQSDFLYDVIVSNPPYFSLSDFNTTKNNNHRKIARHEALLSLHDLVVSISQNLKKTGRVYLVYRFSRFVELEAKLNEVGLFINEYQVVYDIKKETPKVVLLCASFNPDKKKQLEDYYIQ